MSSMTLWAIAGGVLLLAGVIAVIARELRRPQTYFDGPAPDGAEAWSSDVAGMGTELSAFGAVDATDVVATMPWVKPAGPDEIFALVTNQPAISVEASEPMPKTQTQKIHRSSVTGRFVSAKFAKRHKRTTEREKVVKAKKPRKRRRAW